MDSLALTLMHAIPLLNKLARTDFVKCLRELLRLVLVTMIVTLDSVQILSATVKIRSHAVLSKNAFQIFAPDLNVRH